MRIQFRTPGIRLEPRQVLSRVEEQLSLSERGRADALRAFEGLSGSRRPLLPGQCIRLDLGREATWRLLPGVLPAGPVGVLVPAPLWRRGELAPGKGGRDALSLQRGVVRAGVAQLSVESADASREVHPAPLRARLAAAGVPVLGDLENGGVLVAEGLCLADGVDGLVWPKELVFAAEFPSQDAWLEISLASARALERGHPWVLRDEETGDSGRFRPGTSVRAVTTGGRGRDRRPAAIIRLEGESGDLVGRVWGSVSERKGPSLEARVSAALERRRALRTSHKRVEATTTAFRLIHGEADDLPGLAVDRLGPILRCIVTGAASEGFREPLLHLLSEALEAELGKPPPIVEVLRVRDLPNGRFERVRLFRRADVPTWLQVRERGLRFWVAPGLHDPLHATPGTGLYLDQRENRARLAKLARKGRGRWLNLFAHTGAFSAALLSAGAEEVWSVDLSAPYLRWAEANLALNASPENGKGLEVSRHRSIRSEGRRFLEGLEPRERFAGIVLDPPTAAAAGRRFWSVARDFEPLLRCAIAHLLPGGWLLACRNDRRSNDRGGRSLEALLEGAASGVGRSIEQMSSALPGPDFPRLRGFPEGDSFRGVILRAR